jgi:hypothetical protein
MLQQILALGAAGTVFASLGAVAAWVEDIYMEGEQP